MTGFKSSKLKIHPAPFFKKCGVQSLPGQTAAVAQLHRLAGQLQAIERMIGSNAPLEATLQQIEAVRGNLKSLEKRLVKPALGACNNPQLRRCFDYLCKLH